MWRGERWRGERKGKENGEGKGGKRKGTEALNRVLEEELGVGESGLQVITIALSTFFS